MKPSYKKLVVQSLMTCDHQDQIFDKIEGKYGKCSKTCLRKAIQKLKEEEVVLENDGKLKLDSSTLKKMKRKERRRNRPKKALSAYNLFVKTEILKRRQEQSETDTEPVTEMMKSIASAWRGLEESDKLVWKEKAQLENLRRDRS